MLRPTEMDEGLAPRLLWRESSAHAFIAMQCDMRLELSGKFVGGMLPAKEAHDTKERGEMERSP